ncbi:pilus assembly protein TadG-related protein [Amycolatopsis magusensis]|uniref:pilus assembly protein TadG-related protein n=1 Tax=Amycolatopsis magusensis TaxID=882444 RepID=UPI0037A6AAC1
MNRERGSATVWIIGLSVVLILAIGGAVDGTRKAQAHSQATAAAEEAARAAGQALRVRALARGEAAVVDHEPAIAEAHRYLQAVGAEGKASVTGSTITVDATITRPTIFLGLLGISEISARGQGTADLISVG